MPRLSNYKNGAKSTRISNLYADDLRIDLLYRLWLTIHGEFVI